MSPTPTNLSMAPFRISSSPSTSSATVSWRRYALALKSAAVIPRTSVTIASASFPVIDAPARAQVKDDVPRLDDACVSTPTAHSPAGMIIALDLNHLPTRADYIWRPHSGTRHHR